METYHLHMISDSTAETVSMVGRSSLAQFDDVPVVSHVWRMIRNQKQMKEVIDGIEANRGFVLYTLVNDGLRVALEDGCRRLQVPCIPILDPIVGALGAYFGAEVHARPGRQYVMDAEYYSRIEAMHFVLSHDDGQSTGNLNQADVIVLGVSRTSKTPTCIYLANRGIKAANVPIVPGVPLPKEVLDATNPLIVGLTKDPKRLVQIRRNRLRMLNQGEVTDYVDIDSVSQEVNGARRLFTLHEWPVIDVTRRSIEETAATILHLYSRRMESVS
jgi:regulator of PEP synthase PpsR (kinase-PPPase family)